MKIQLKRSGVLENGSAKKPTKEQTEYGELCVNYNVDDPALFIKDSNDNIIRLAGSGAEAGGLPNGGTGDRPTSPGIGDLFFDTDLNLIVYWDGNNWIPLGSNTIVQDTVPATNYAEGTLWWNSSDDSGQLFILYNDPSGGGGGDLGGPKWVEASPTTGGSGSGAEVLISPTAPAVDDLDEGTLWWNSDSSDLKLYVLYNDPSPDAGKKWIEASPGGGGVSEDDAVLKNPAGGASQNIAGDITLGTDKITLNATGGSITGSGEYFTKAEFGGYFINGSGGDYDSGLFATKRNGDNRRFVAINAGNGDPAIAFDTTNKDVLFVGDPGNSGSLTNPLATISGSGSATFAGAVQTGAVYVPRDDGAIIGVLTSPPGTGDVHLEASGAAADVKIGNAASVKYITFDASGTTTFPGTMFSGTNDNPSGYLKITNDSSSITDDAIRVTNSSDNRVVQIKVNGDARFKGTVTENATRTGEVLIELERDDPANYTTTMVDGEETQVYSGPTLDVKEKLMEALATIEDLKTRIAALEA